ncbi:interleukin-18 receptor 1 isoform X2 [Tupaia chinensis]|uniref:interleukin-18 receptor 1 isoform X2 n=1 Tax=Tupaia chinensis TaxID=246437 RepID=UPI000703D9F2|nr:interleukin-18 receptor 1 isoform X2 [Tupaia chinensis]XP_027623321.1 interleukin-18 receptor 1 isoform X2 [Tupaia chinensis]
MHHREWLLTLWVLLLIRSSEACTSRDFITALEGEPFYLKYCSSLPVHETAPSTIRWVRSSKSHEPMELKAGSSPRITVHGYTLEFWPIESDDEGNYSLKVGNDTKTWTLNVVRRNKTKCFTEELVRSRLKEVEKVLDIDCENSYYQHLVNQTSLYKNCEKIAESNKNPLIRKDAEFTDQGYYTCVLSIHHNGKLFNVTHTYNVTIVKGLGAISPALLGPKRRYIEVELGSEVELNCTALVNEDDQVYWVYQRDDGSTLNEHEGNLTKFLTSEGKWFASRILKIKNVIEKNLNFSYKCTAINTASTDIQNFILIKQGRADLPSHVFRRGIITAISVSAAVVCLTVLCVLYRVDLVLFYRNLTERDETLTDGKTYDAFVSYLKECRPENGEEHAFAVETLPRVLEEHFGYKLCIFERDVAPGGAVVDEIHSLIEKSRRLIIVLSKSYMSNEVRYELETGLHEALVERKIKIILIEFTPVSDLAFLPQSLELLKSHRVLKWKAEKSLSYNSRFWKNLLYLMPAKAVKPGRK